MANSLLANGVVGLVGLGLMGDGIVRRLIGSGHAVVGFDIAPDRVQTARSLGVTIADSPADVARQAELILICVTTSQAVGEVIAGPHGFLATGALVGKTIVDLSTTEIELTKRLAAAVAAAGGAFIDAPVSGGPGAASAGTLAIMAGAEMSAFDAVRPVLEQLGTVTHMGSVGAGQATKLVNQTLVLRNL